MSLWGRLREAFKPTATLAPVDSQPLYRQRSTYLLFDFLAGVADPDEVLRRTGRTRADLRALLRDAEVSQAIDTRREAVIATPWRLEPTKSRAEKFVAAELAPHIVPLIRAFLDAVLYGYQPVEVVYAKRGGRVGIGSVYAPPFEWFRPLPGGGLRFFPQTGEGGIDGLPCDEPKYFLATRNADYRNPFGEALLSTLYWPVTWRLQGWQLWLDFLDTFGAPIVVGKVGAYEKFIEAMAAQGVKRAVAWQAQDEKESLSTITASTAGEFERLEEALSKTITKVVLGQTLTSDVGKTGSFAAAKVHDEVRDDKRRADLRIVCEPMQRIVNALWSLNAFPGDAPQFVMQDDTGLERERADRDAVLAGALGVRFTPEYLTERYDLEPEDFTVVDPQPALPSGINPRETVNQSARAGRFTPNQQAVEDAVDAVVKDAPQPLTIKQLRGAIAAAKDERDLAERLAVLIDRQDPAYPELLARAQFAAQVLGYVHAAEAPITA